MNKKGWLRILEAFIGIILITGFLLFVIAKQTTKVDVGEEIGKLQEVILNQIANNESLREAVLDGDPEPHLIRNFVESRTPNGFESEINICRVDNVCGPENYHKEMYVREVIISTKIEVGTGVNPKKLKIFIWRVE